MLLIDFEGNTYRYPILSPDVKSKVNGKLRKYQYIEIFKYELPKTPQEAVLFNVFVNTTVVETGVRPLTTLIIGDSIIYETKDIAL